MEKDRVIYFDILNICACIAVIFLHCNGSAHTYSDTWGWRQALSVEVLMYWAVPVFFMLSGANLMGYRERYSTTDFLKKRFIKTAIPFLFWSVVTVFTKGLWDTMREWGPRRWLNSIFLTKIEQVYWFFIPLFALYLCMPVLSCLTDKKYRRTLWYLVVVSFVVQSVIPVVFPKLGLDFYNNISFPVAGGMVLYVVLGYLLATEEFSSKFRYILYALGIMSMAFRYIMTIILSTRADVIDKTYFGYMQFHAVLQACAVFLLFKQICSRFKVSDKAGKIIAKISSCSFGIYLTHMIVYRFLRDYVGLSSSCIQWRLFAPFLIYGICFIGVFIIKKIPVLKNVVP